MGIYDRDYNRDEQFGEYGRPGLHIQGPTTVTTKLVLATVIIFLVQLLSGNWVTETFALRYDWYYRPWQVYQLLTYGFLHSTGDLWHIVLNMFGLWMFGREVERRYGQREYLVFYLAAIVFAGIVWTLAELASPGHYLVGASGGLTAIVILFAFNFPHQIGLFMFVLPMPMWVIAILIVVIDAFGAYGRSGDVAFTAHLGGAMFAAIYYKAGWRLDRWLPDASFLARLRPGPNLRVHRSDDVEEDDDGDEAVDDILRKIAAHGQDSLTRRERRILQQASQKEQNKRRDR
jgi:membrane associated rhomboid family serine protease